MNNAKEAHVRAEVEKLRSLDKTDLRARWRKMFGKEPPPALTKDLLGRMIAWRIQERFYGGHDKATIKLLDGLARGEAAKLDAGPRIKPGTVLMREHRGVRHTVTVVPNGFVWQEQTYPSRPSRAPLRAPRGTGRASLACASSVTQIRWRRANDPARPRKAARCAIYIRKSTEHNLDLEFNSLDAQRKACEASGARRLAADPDPV